MKQLHVAVVAALSLLGVPVTAAEITIMQSGSSNSANVQQLGVTGSRVTVDQSGAFNQIDVLQTQGADDIVEVVQGGSANQAGLVQSGPVGGTTRNVAVVRQLGSGGDIDIVQAMSGATTAVLQSALSSGNRASVYQSAVGPIGVIQQGVGLPDNRRTLDVAAEASAVRYGGAFLLASSTQSTASLTQVGGAGLAAIVVQSGAGQIASVSQAGSYLETEILQSGGAHSASVAQSGSGTASSPYRASVTQLGAQPQSFSVTQQAGSSPRSIRVIQR